MELQAVMQLLILQLKLTLLGTTLQQNTRKATGYSTLFVGHGDEVYTFLADGEEVNKGDYLESAGDGTLKKHTPVDTEVPVNAIVARAIEGVNNSTGDDPVRIKVEVL